MKTILLNASLGAFLCSSSISEAAPPLPKAAVFSASVENAKFEEKDSSISLDFVLKNNTGKTIAIAKRWNSWGAFQWTVNVTTADHKIEFSNPQIAWWRNHLEAANIEPGKELRLKCRLAAKGSTRHHDGIEVFTSKEENLHYTFPVHLVGTFFAASLHSDGQVATNWAGTIKTPKVELKK